MKNMSPLRGFEVDAIHFLGLTPQALRCRRSAAKDQRSKQ